MENKAHSNSEVCTPGKALRRMMKSLLWLAVTTAVYLVMSWLVKRHPEWSPARRVLATLTPLLPGVFYLLSLLRAFWAMDELQRRIQLEAWVFALAGTVVVTAVMNVLNANGMGLADYPHGLQVGGVYMTMFLLWSVGVAISSLRYR